MQDNERKKDQLFAERLTPAQQEQADRLSGGVWEKTFIAGVAIVLGMAVLAAPLLSGLARFWPPFSILAISFAALAFALVCVSILMGSKERRRRFLESTRD